MASESSAILRRFPSLQLQDPEVSETLEQMCRAISQTTTEEMVEVANSATCTSQSKLQELLPVYFYSWRLQSLEAVIIYLLLHYFILWQDSSEKRREDRQAFEEYIERLKIRVAELEEKLYESRTEACQMKAELDKMRAQKPDPEMSRLLKQVQNFRLENEKMERAHDEVGVLVCMSVHVHCSICACREFRIIIDESLYMHNRDTYSSIHMHDANTWYVPI